MSVKERKTLRDLNLVDRFLFDESMEDPEVYRTVVSIVLERETELLGRIQTEKELRVAPGLRSVRLDVVGVDTAGKVYYTEMQKRDTGNLIKRSRYYQGQLDVSLLETGCVDFNRLNDTCLILIAPFDIFGRGLYRYTFEGVCKECPDLMLNDGAARVFINTKGTNRKDFTQEFLDFMEYVTNTTDEVASRSSSEKIRRMHEKIQGIRMSEEMGVKFMQKWEERVYDRLDGKAEGRAEGRAEGKVIALVEQVQKKRKRGKPLSQIAEEMEESEEAIRPYYEAIAASPDKAAEDIAEDMMENGHENGRFAHALLPDRGRADREKPGYVARCHGADGSQDPVGTESFFHV